MTSLKQNWIHYFNPMQNHSYRKIYSLIFLAFISLTIISTPAQAIEPGSGFLPACWNIRKFIKGGGETSKIDFNMNRPSFSGLPFDYATLSSNVIPPVIADSRRGFKIHPLGLLKPECGLSYTLLSPFAAISGVIDVIRSPFGGGLKMFQSGIITLVYVIINLAIMLMIIRRIPYALFALLIIWTAWILFS